MYGKKECTIRELVDSLCKDDTHIYMWLTAFLLQDSSLVLQSQQNINITSGQSQLSVSPEAITVNTPTFSIYNQDSTSEEEEEGERDRPVLTVTNQSVTVNAHSLEVGRHITLDRLILQPPWPLHGENREG